MAAIPLGASPGVGQEGMPTRKAEEILASGYEQVRVWDEDSNTRLIRRKADGQLFLGYPWEPSAQFAGLLERGAGEAVAALLNHANLVNIINNISVQVFQGSSEDKVEYFSVWDFCDAGSLSGFMRRPAGTGGVPRQEVTADGRIKKFLPESLVWHVALSMLKALAWLHEGYRQEPCIAWVGGEPIPQIRGWRAEEEQDGALGEDWMPILHRNIRADNIFFQHPRGSETYGYCKLGNFSEAFVSGHVHNNSGGQVVCSEDDAVSLDKLRQYMAVEDIYTVKKSQRPYFKGTDLYHLGEVLYQMMTRKEVPDREECTLCRGQHHEPQDVSVQGGHCPLGGHFFLGTELGIDEEQEPMDTALEYTARLRVLVYIMLSQQYRGSGSGQVAGLNAIQLLQEAERGYMAWKATSADGQLYCDETDDLLLRAKNKQRKEEADEDSAKRQSGPDAVDVLDLV